MSKEYFWIKVCNNFKDQKEESYHLGYADKKFPFILFPGISIVLNLLIILTYLRRNCKQKQNSIYQRDSMEKMLYVMTYFELILSIYMLTNAIVFYDLNNMNEYCGLCFFSSIFAVFFYNFDWIFFGFSLHNLLSMINNPHNEGNFSLRLRWYFIIALSIASIYVLIMISGEIYGISPMLTCFIRHEIKDPGQYISMFSLLIVPVVYLIYYIYAFVSIFRKYLVQSNKEFKILIIKYLFYSLVYVVFYFPIFLLYNLSLNIQISKNTNMSWFSYYCTIFSIIKNPILSLMKIFEGFIKFQLKAILPHKCLDETLLSENSKDFESEEKDIDVEEKKTTPSSTNLFQVKRKKTGSSFKKFYGQLIKGFMKEIFLALSYSVDNSVIENFKNIKSKFINESVRCEITKSSYHEDFEKEIPDDLYIEIIEYAPKVFHKIRELENLTKEKLMNSLAPVNNISLIKTQGKSNSFFCSTDDNKFILKTITREEFEFILNNFLIFYYMYLSNNSDSLICRIFGIFKIKIGIDGEALTIILMRDGKGPLKNFIKSCYDLKGSKYKRETKSDTIVALECRKDLNFDKEIGHLDIEERTKFIESIKQDSEFFEDLNIMDYSLLVLRLEFNNTTYKQYEEFLKSSDYQHYKRYIYPSKQDKMIVYTLIIIDYLQIYHFIKYLENNIKVHLIERPENKDDISCVDPSKYANRFYQYMKEITEREKGMSLNVIENEG